MSTSHAFVSEIKDDLVSNRSHYLYCSMPDVALIRLTSKFSPFPFFYFSFVHVGGDKPRGIYDRMSPVNSMLKMGTIFKDSMKYSQNKFRSFAQATPYDLTNKFQAGCNLYLVQHTHMDDVITLLQSTN